MSSLERIDRFLAIVCGIAVVAAVFVLLAGPEFIGADKTTKSASGGKSPAASAPDGKAIFSGNCAGCHTLSAAGSSGSVGPNLDELKPDAALVKQTVENGAGVMPSFGGKLSDAEVAAVAAFVSSSAR